MQHPTVFVTQIPVRRDAETGSLTPAVNIITAQEYGDIEVLAPARVGYTHIPDTIKNFDDALCGYDDSQGDCLLPLGDPVLTAIAVGILARRGEVSILKWDKNLGRYLKTFINFIDEH
jgi:hypothetical protein